MNECLKIYLTMTSWRVTIYQKYVTNDQITQ